MRRESQRTGAGTALKAALIGAIAAAIALAVLAPADWLAVESPALRVAIKTAAGVGVAIVWWITVLRVERTGLRGDAALSVAIGIVSAAAMAVAFLTLVADVRPSAHISWIPVPGRLAAGGLLIAAGLLDRAPRSNPPRRLTFVAGTALIAASLAGAGAGAGALVGSHIPLALQLVCAAMFAFAAIALAGRAQRQEDPVLSWFAAAALVLATARVVAVLAEPSGHSWLALSDLVTLGAVGLLVMGARAESREVTGRTVAQALDLERRRLAREIHDGLAQELAFIVSQSRRLARRSPNAGALELLARAGETALMDSRRIIFTLKAPSLKALSTAVTERAFQVADRSGLAIDVEVLDQVSVTPDVEHAILRIIDEAVSNASRHAGATSVSIRIFSEEGRVVVRISDDGYGFDDSAPQRRRGFGLVSMAERTESLGGSMELKSEPGEGTVIEVAF
jgi:signal transduction histidine kinase